MKHTFLLLSKSNAGTQKFGMTAELLESLWTQRRRLKKILAEENQLFGAALRNTDVRRDVTCGHRLVFSITPAATPVRKKQGAGVALLGW